MEEPWNDLLSYNGSEVLNEVILVSPKSSVACRWSALSNIKPPERETGSYSEQRVSFLFELKSFLSGY